MTSSATDNYAHVAGQLLQGIHTDDAKVEIDGVEKVPAWSNTYGNHEVGTLIAILDSLDRSEIAIVNGNAAQSLNLAVGSQVEVVIQVNFC